MFKTRGGWTDRDVRFIKFRAVRYEILINTGLQPGAMREKKINRFNGFIPMKSR
jgi:hypothetical protein